MSNFSAIHLNVNGEIRSALVRPSDTLLTVLREKLGLTGAKPGVKMVIAELAQLSLTDYR